MCCTVMAESQTAKKLWSSPGWNKTKQFKGSSRGTQRTAGTLLTSQRDPCIFEEDALQSVEQCHWELAHLQWPSEAKIEWERRRGECAGHEGQLVRMDVCGEAESHTQHVGSLCWCWRLILLVGFLKNSQAGVWGSAGTRLCWSSSFIPSSIYN